MGGKQSHIRREAEVTQRFQPAEQIHMLPFETQSANLLTHGEQSSRKPR